MKTRTNRGRYDQALLNHEEERRLIARWQQHRDPAALDALVAAFKPLIERLLVKASKSEDVRKRIRSAGTLGIMRALETFELERGLRLSTYAQAWIRVQMQEDLVNEVPLVRLPFRSRMYREAGSLLLAGIDVSDAAAIAKAGRARGLDEADIQCLQQHFAAKTNLDAPAFEGGQPIGAAIASDENLERSVARRQALLATTAMLELAFERLTDREKEIVSSRILADDGQKLRELAARYGITRERVRQIEGSALRKLRASIPVEEAYEALEALAA